jgi:2-keto-3-deoxy-L-rhamnonate aldolase RhmA
MKVKMDSGQLAIGMIVRLMRSVEIAVIAKTAGFDSIYIDLEHCSFSLETVSQISATAVALGITPLVRLPGLNKSEIGRALEVGAQGVIIPHVERRTQAEEVVDAARFPPHGSRSLLGANPHTQFRVGPATDTMRKINEATLVTVMIESVRGVENADEIASVHGVDMLLIGTNDLCNSFGAAGSLDHPRVREAYEHVASVCRARSVHLGVGGLNSRPELAKEMIKLGARYVSAGSDTGFLTTAAAATAQIYQ